MKIKIFITLTILCFIAITVSSSSRLKYSINESWKFHKGDISTVAASVNDSLWQTVTIPHTWNTDDVMDDIRGYYRGIGWYSKKITLPASFQGKKVYLHFEGANQVTEVFINGSFIGKHIGGYTAFRFDITNYISIETENILSVKVDNSNNKDIAPLSADFTFYGGIYRDVYLIATNPVHFDMTNNASKGLLIQTPTVSTDNATVRIFGKVLNESNVIRKIKIISKIKDANRFLIKEIVSNIKLSPGMSMDIEQNEKMFTGYKLWSPENPYLYSISTQIVDATSGEIVDEVLNPLAFRFYRFDADKGFFLNGKPYKIIGVNRHQDYKLIGNALPDYLHLRDMELLKEMGANYIRISHYPQDEAVLEACDRLGILASIEPPMVNYITESDAFSTNIKNLLTEMIYQNYNHPSVIIWCLMNEICLNRPFRVNVTKEFDSIVPRELEYFKNVGKLAKEMNDIAKKIDPSRATMIANHGYYKTYKVAGLTDIPDVVGWNLYYGWYMDPINGLDSFLLKDHRVNLPTKPLMITEYGADCDTRIRSSHPLRYDYSVDWANRYHEYYLKTIQKYDFVAGGVIWNLIDFNSEGRDAAIPHVNLKGMLTQDRKPKDLYYFYQSKLLNTPVVKILPALCDKRSGVQDSLCPSVCTQRIWVYANIENVLLTANGKAIQKAESADGKTYFDVSFHDGKNTLVATINKDGQPYSDAQTVEFSLLPRMLNSTEMAFKPINIKCGAHYSYTDNMGQVWMPDQPYQKGSWGYIGGKMHIRSNKITPGEGKDIFGTSDDPLFQTQHVGACSYQIDVPQGEYEVTLYFAEILSKRDKEKMLNLLATEKDATLTTRIFNVNINGNSVIENLDVAKTYGESRPVVIKFPVSMSNTNGVKIDFEAVKGDPIINAIQVRRIY